MLRSSTVSPSRQPRMPQASVSRMTSSAFTCESRRTLKRKGGLPLAHQLYHLSVRRLTTVYAQLSAGTENANASIEVRVGVPFSGRNILRRDLSSALFASVAFRSTPAPSSWRTTPYTSSAWPSETSPQDVMRARSGSRPGGPRSRRRRRAHHDDIALD